MIGSDTDQAITAACPTTTVTKDTPRVQSQRTRYATSNCPSLKVRCLLGVVNSECKEDKHTGISKQPCAMTCVSADCSLGPCSGEPYKVKEASWSPSPDANF